MGIAYLLFHNPLGIKDLISTSLSEGTYTWNKYVYNSSNK